MEKKYFWKKKNKKKKFFWEKLFCEKVPILSQKMMIYHKMCMSEVYENKTYFKHQKIVDKME